MGASDSENEIVWKIKTPADLQGLKDAKAALEESIKVTKAMGGDATKLEEQLKGVDLALSSEGAAAVKLAEHLQKAITGMKQAGGNAAELEKQLAGLHEKIGVEKKGFFEGLGEELSKEVPGLEKFGAAATGTAAKVAVAGLVIKEGMDKAVEGIREFAHAQEAQFKIDAALAQTGNLTHQARTEIDGLVRELKEATGTDWAATVTRLLQFGADPGKLKEYTEGVKNLAAVMGGDVESAGHVFVRAMEGNYEILRRYGIKIDETGTSTERMERLMTELAARGGGQLEARMQGLTGQSVKLKEAFYSNMQVIGQFLAQGLELSAWAEKLDLTYGERGLAGKLHSLIPQMDGLSNAARKTKQSFDDLDESTKRTTASLNVIDQLGADSEKATDQRVAALLREQAAMDEQAEAAKRLALEKIKVREASGEITKEDAELLTARVENRGAADKTGRKAATAEAVKKAAQDALAEAESESAAATERRERAEKRPELIKESEKAADQYNALKEERSRVGGQIDQLTKETLEKKELAARSGGVPPDMAKYVAELTKLQTKQEQINRDLEESWKKRQEIEEHLGPGGTRDIASAEAAIPAAKAQEEHFKEQAKKAAEKYLPVATAAQQEADQARRIEAINQKTREQEYKEKFIREHGGDAGESRPAANGAEAVQRYNQDNQMIDRLVHTILTGHGNQRTIALLERVISDQGQMARTIARLQAEQKKTTSQIIHLQS